MPVLELTEVSKSFGAIHAVTNVSLGLERGEVLGLMGDNGAGKSTLMKIIAGNFRPSHGTIAIEGRPVAFHRPVEARAAGIEIVYQDLALCDNLDVVHNMFLGREVKSGLTLNETEMEKRTGSTLRSLSVRTLRSLRQLLQDLMAFDRLAKERPAALA